MSMITTKSVIDEIGEGVIASRLGVSIHSVRYARYAGSFSASWYEGLTKLCHEHGLDCPMSLFNMRRPQTSEGSAA